MFQLPFFFSLSLTYLRVYKSFFCVCVVVVVCNNGTRRKRLGLWREPHADGPLLVVIVVVLISSIVQQKKKTKGESVCLYENRLII